MTAPSVDSLPRNRRTAAFERRVARALTVADVDAEPRTILVAVSGGPDSTAALATVARAIGAPRTIAAYFDHRWRSLPERRAERAAVQGLADSLGVTMTAGTARGPIDRSEAAAREARYRWLARVYRRVDAAACVTGHTLDDQAETVLLRLARGSGALGAAGMQSIADWPIPIRGSHGLQVVRPLLGIGREEVEEYLRALNVQALRDPSNESTDYGRNRIRHEVLPALRQVNTRASEHLAAFAAASRADEDALTAIALQWLHAHRTPGPPGRGGLPRQELRALPEAIAIRVVRELGLDRGMVLDATHLHAIVRILDRSGARVDLPGGVARTAGQALHLDRHLPRPGQD